MEALRCKQGDVAVINRVPVTNPDYGKIVTCLKFIGDNGVYRHKDLWEIDNKVSYTDGIKQPFCPDEALTPLRYDEGEDEMVTIMRNKTLDKPVEETQQKETV